MTLQIVYLAALRERAGCGTEATAVPPSVTDVAGLIEWLRQRGGGPAAALADLACVRVAVNHEYVALTHPVRDGDEVAFFPPVTGGAG